MHIYPSVIENIANHADAMPEKLALADNKQSLTYSELWTRIYGLSQVFRSMGVKDENCAVVECNQSVDYMICGLAIQLAGGVFVPLEKNVAKTRAIEIITDTEATLYVSKKPLDAELPEGISPAFFCIDECAMHPWEGDIPELTFPKSEDVCEILFSTGTTGKSKGIVLTHGNDIAIAENVMYGVKMKENNVEMIPMPTSHSHGLRRTYSNLVNGSSVVFVDGVTLLKKVFNMIEEYHVTSMDLSPSMLSIIFKLSKDRLGDYADQMDYIQLGSAPLPEEDKVHLSRILPKTRLYNFYGSTEAGCSCLLDFNSMAGKKGCIGKPAVNAHFIVVDENRNEIESSPDNLGFLASSGAINMKEYFKAPELTEATMANGFVYTKDLGYIDEEGLVYMLGRKDDVINYGGIKISPEELEAVIVKNPIIKDCAVIPVKDALTGQAPKLLIALENPDGSDYDPKEFKSFLQESLDANKQPKYIEIIDEIPRTFNGKIKRNQLMDREKN
ncbi:MAG: class I adenylate-forming enzyme family protein [Bacillota bacterium]|nr:class I adenylate-forming enzyme family protein [Bacillota bacterium]